MNKLLFNLRFICIFKWAKNNFVAMLRKHIWESKLKINRFITISFG